jgi:hypothetical protein
MKAWTAEQLALPPQACKDCHKVKPITDYPKNRTSPNGVYPVCMECYKAKRNKGKAKQEGSFRGEAKTPRVRASQDDEGETPTRRRGPVAEPALPADLEITTIRRLSQLPYQRYAVECSPFTLMGVLKSLRDQKRVLDGIYLFTNRVHGKRYFVYSSEPKPVEPKAKKRSK